MVSTVVTPRPTLAGDAPLFNQNETQEMMTIRLQDKKHRISAQWPGLCLSSTGSSAARCLLGYKGES